MSTDLGLTLGALEPRMLLAAGAGQHLLEVLLYAVVGLIACAGVGAALAVLRVVLPGVAGAADRSVAATSTRRLLLMGALPVLGAALLGRAVEALGAPALGVAYALLVVLPLGLALVAGAMGAVPWLGERLLERGTPRSPLARAAGGAVALGLAATTAWLPPLFALVALLVLGWLLGIGLGALGGRRPPATAA